jgi:hypothetical protein
VTAPREDNLSVGHLRATEEYLADLSLNEEYGSCDEEHLREEC